ncbi:ceramidase [Paraburkholderia sp. MMS20-SJTR3]|uniref:Ceramidase n=1 Tax=Paraburkholderia sejongensis TaxID=2886946 RepID=A0ABS8K0M5_9BURK|nr:ceramidase [Paraburkholderia sp. MMS20-SJTR3]MCC8395705.1 ceramidase [Paraburkholderia sp. MMS20-SJTR3]
MKTSRLLTGSVLLFVIGALLQLIWPLAQAASYHHFADQRSLGPLHNAADVLSNLVILAAGLLAIGWVRRHAARQPLQFPGMVVAAFGLVLTAFGSAYYHMTPTDATLVWDRLPMTIVFAGILAMLWTSWSGERVGWPQLLILAIVSPATVGYWLVFNSLWPYAILQFGGLMLIVGMTLTRKVDGVFAWSLVIVFYGVAKIFESLDWQIWELTHHVIAGHALKHVSSGLAGASMILVANATPRAAAGSVSRRPAGIGHSGSPR